MTSMFTIDQVAIQLHVQPRTVRTLIKRGQLTAFRVGRVYRISPHHVEQFKLRQEVIGSVTPHSAAARRPPARSCRLPGSERYL
jgi:excisionase family DNA binding protein